MIIEPHGVLGRYGNFGALEKYVGNRQIAERAQKAYSAVGIGRAPEELTPLFLEKGALSGDEIAAKLWEDIGFEIGIMLTNIAWLLNPDRIVIGGGIAKAGPLVFERVNRTIRERFITSISRWSQPNWVTMEALSAVPRWPSPPRNVD